MLCPDYSESKSQIFSYKRDKHENESKEINKD